jgi:hypothetical protein
MRFSIAAAVVATALGAVLALPAQADSLRQHGIRGDGHQGQELSSQNRPRVQTTKRGRPRITVRRRSYLDAGTEVFPGSKSYTDYVFPPGYTAYSNVDPTGASRWPLPGPFELRSYHAPGFGY